MNHMFDVEVAKEVGIVAAILFQSLGFWCQHNKANGTNFHDGRYWTYNTVKAYCEMFPYMTDKSIRNGLQKLKDSDLIVTGNYNKDKRDRTTWYALTDKGNDIFFKGKLEFPKWANKTSEKGEALPDIDTDINTDKNSDKNTYSATSSEISDIISYLNDKAGTHYRTSSEATKKHIHARLSEGYTVEDFHKVIDNKCTEWLGTDMDKFLRPETLFGNKFESYLNTPTKSSTNKSTTSDVNWGDVVV